MSNTSSFQAKKSSKKTLTRIGFILIMLALGGLAGYFIGGQLKDPTSTTSYPIYYKLLLLPIAFLVIFMVLAIHELGHTLAGILVGFEFRMITVGPFMLRKEPSETNPNQIRFRWNTRLNAMGGLALCLPKTEHHLRSNFIKFVAGGPLASLLLALLAGVVYFMLFRH